MELCYFNVFVFLFYYPIAHPCWIHHQARVTSPSLLLLLTDWIAQGKVVALRAKNGEKSRFAVVDRSINENSHHCDEDEHNRFRQRDRQQERPIDGAVVVEIK